MLVCPCSTRVYMDWQLSPCMNFNSYKMHLIQLNWHIYCYVIPHSCLQVLICPKDSYRLERSSCLYLSQAVYTLHCSIPQTCQVDLNPANLEATVEAEWILAFLFLQKRHFSMTSSLCSVVHVLMAHFTIFQSHGLSGWFMPKIMNF